MKSLAFFPIAYLAGEHGFVFFAPYLALVLVALHMAKAVSKPRPAPTVAAPN